MGFFDFLSGGIVEAVGKVADDLITSDEERAEKENEKLKANLAYKAQMRESDIKETEIYLEDKQSAREMNSNLVASKDWLVRNTGSLLAWFIVIGTVALDYMIAFDNLKDAVADKEVLMFILGSMNTYTAGVISFYFGSSKTEADSKRTIH
ncbi:hypothetical protein [Sulfurimonas sp.]